MTRYVLGFIFNRDLSMVALMLKNRPAWQRGRYNGVGGHIEAGETPLAAMIREGQEETGILATGWEEVVTMRRDAGGSPFECVVYRLILDDPELESVGSPTDEPVVPVPWDRLPANCLSNLYWLIPMCRDLDAMDGDPYFLTGRVGLSRERLAAERAKEVRQ